MALPLSDTTTDRGLLEALVHGDGAAVEELYRRHRIAVFNLAWQLIGDRGVAEDALQDVFVRLVEGAARDRVRDVRAYLRSAVLNRSRDLVRRRRTQRADACDPAEAVDAPGPADAAVSSERVVEVNRALQRLPLEQREVVVLHVFEGMAFRAIGQALGISANTAMSRYRYAKAALRSLLGRLDPNEV